MTLSVPLLLNPFTDAPRLPVLAVCIGANQAAEFFLSSLLYCSVIGELLCSFYSSWIHEQVTSY